MVDVRFERVTALPTPATANTLYFVRGAGLSTVELWISGNDATPIPIGNGANVYDLLNTVGASQLAGHMITDFISAADNIDSRLTALGF